MYPSYVPEFCNRTHLHIIMIYTLAKSQPVFHYFYVLERNMLQLVGQK